VEVKRSLGRQVQWDDVVTDLKSVMREKTRGALGSTTKLGREKKCLVLRSQPVYICSTPPPSEVYKRWTRGEGNQTLKDHSGDGGGEKPGKERTSRPKPSPRHQNERNHSLGQKKIKAEEDPKKCPEDRCVACSSE